MELLTHLRRWLRQLADFACAVSGDLIQKYSRTPARPQELANLIVRSTQLLKDAISFFPKMVKVSLIVPAFLAVLAGSPLALAADSQQPDKSLRPRLIPASFEVNLGQADPDVRYLSRGAGSLILFQDQEVDFVLAQSEDGNGRVRLDAGRGSLLDVHSKSPVELIRMCLAGTSENIELSGQDRLPGIVNYFYGKKPSQWHTQIPTYSKLQYGGVYPGIDLVYYENSNKLEFDFRLAPEASTSRIKLRFAPTQQTRLDSSGDLVVFAGQRSVAFRKPLVYQTNRAGAKRRIKGGFRRFADGSIGFAVGAYDHTRPLVIDPVLDYSTYLGDISAASSVAVDSNGEAFVAGSVYSAVPTTAGSFQPNLPAAQKNDQSPVGTSFFIDSSAFVAKFNSTGTALVYCTYLSGSENDAADAIAVDGAGDAFVAGATASPDFPVTTGSFQTSNHAGRGGTGFITELNNTGSQLVYSTFLGGSQEAAVTGIALDNTDNAFVTGYTADLDFPVTLGAFQTTSPANPVIGGKGFITKVAAGGKSLLYSTYVGGSKWDLPFGITIDAAENAYITGGTQSPDFPTTQGAFQTVNKATVFNLLGGSFVTKLNPSGTKLVYSTYLDGSFTDVAYAIAVDASGSAYVTGYAASPDFPTTPASSRHHCLPKGLRRRMCSSRN